MSINYPQPIRSQASSLSTNENAQFYFSHKSFNHFRHLIAWLGRVYWAAPWLLKKRNVICFVNEKCCDEYESKSIGQIVNKFKCMLDGGSFWCSFCGSTLITWYIGSRISICSQPLRPLVSCDADNCCIVHELKICHRHQNVATLGQV